MTAPLAALASDWSESCLSVAPTVPELLPLLLPVEEGLGKGTE